MRRTRAAASLKTLLKESPIVALLGPRQSGKTTLARDVAKAGKTPTFRFDLEDPLDIARLENPSLALAPLRGLVILDEIQRRPELFPLLRVLVDRQPRQQRFLILGSASGDLLRQSSESLAGRVTFRELMPFSLFEETEMQRLWLRGGFPRAYLAKSLPAAWRWLDDYITTFLERDIPAIGLRVPAVGLRRFWMMLAHYHGQTLNHSALGRSLGIADNTVRHYLDILTQTFMIRQLQPWHENISKRQVKAPKLYFRDSGLLHRLLAISDARQLEVHPKVGASWEGFALESVLRELDLPAGAAFFWATHADAELDLMIFLHGRRFGFEFKRADAPAITRSMRVAIDDLALAHLFVVFPGATEFALAGNITAVGLGCLRDPGAQWRQAIKGS